MSSYGGTGILDKGLKEKEDERQIRQTLKRQSTAKQGGRLCAAAALLMEHLMLAGICAVMAFPFLWMVVSALKTKAEIMDPRLFFPAQPAWGNFMEVIFNSPVPRYMLNSLGTSLVISALQVITGAMLAFALVFMRFRGRRLLFGLVMGTYMIPSSAAYITDYTILAGLDLLDSYGGLILSCTVSLFSVFLLRQAFLQLPFGLVEAARMDGAGAWRILWKIAYPLVRPAFITAALFSFIGNYNSYMWPSLITESPEKALISQGLRMYFIDGGAYGTNWPMVMGAGAVAVIPLLVLFAAAQKWFIKGISDTGMKGE